MRNLTFRAIPILSAGVSSNSIAQVSPPAYKVAHCSITGRLKTGFIQTQTVLVLRIGQKLLKMETAG